MKGKGHGRSSRGRVHLALAVCSLLLLFLIGPLHVWHHTDESMQGPDGKCLPCSNFHKTFWIQTADTGSCWVQPFAGFAAQAPDFHPDSVTPRASASRAPPSSTC